MHPNVTDAMALLRDIYRDPGNVAKVIDRTQRAYKILAEYNNQGRVMPATIDAPEEAVAVEPETKPAPKPKRK